MRLVVALIALTLGCAEARPPVKSPAPPKVVAPPPPPDKVSEAELLHYKAAFLEFKAIESGIVARYRIDAAAGEVFDADSGAITRKPLKPSPVAKPAPAPAKAKQ